MKISREQVNVLIQNGQKSGLTGKQVLDGLIQRGYEPEGINVVEAKKSLPVLSPSGEQVPEKSAIQKLQERNASSTKELFGDVKDAGNKLMDDSVRRSENVNEIEDRRVSGEVSDPRAALQKAGQYAGAGADAIGTSFKLFANSFLGDKGEKKVTAALSKGVGEAMKDPVVKNFAEGAQKWYDSLDENQKADVDAAGGAFALASEFITAGGAKKLVGEGVDIARRGISTASTAAKNTAENVLQSTAKATDTILNKSSDIVRSVKEPSVSDAVKTSLNPTEALANTAQDVDVSVGGKVKKLSQMTPEEKSFVQAETAKNYDDFTKQAELFKKDRAVPEGSPVEIVGKRTDQALEVAQKKMQKVGEVMGTIEEKYLDVPVPTSEKVLKTFTDTLKDFENPRFGSGSSSSAPLVRKLVSDFDKIEAAGSTIKDRLEFIRAWQNDIRNAKDAFGNFEKDKGTWSKIQRAVEDLRKETVDHISDTDPTYKALRKQYAEHVKLQEIGDQLLGKEGAFGERIKGAATVKRAIQSNSDAGARQFMTKLKQITGYDGIKEGDLALLAMENVGDYQGLSLLNVLKDGKEGLIKKGLEKVRDVVVGNDTTRVKRYIKKK